MPVGRYTMGVIDKTNLADALKPKWIYGESVRQVLDYRSTGRAVAVCVVAWLVGFAISCGITAMAVGGAAVLGGLAGAAA